MLSQCDSCLVTFDNKNLYRNHRKKCVTTATITTYAGEQIVLHRNQDHVFLCYCSHPACPKPNGFVTAEAVQKHMKKLQTTWLGPEEKASNRSFTSENCF